MHTNLSSEDVMRMRIKRRRERQEERKRAILEARASSDDYKTKVRCTNEMKIVSLIYSPEFQSHQYMIDILETKLAFFQS